MASTPLSGGKRNVGHGISTQTTVTVTDNNALAYAAPEIGKERVLLQLQNCSSPTGGDVYISFGVGASVGTPILRLPPYGLIVYDAAVPQGAVYAVADTSMSPLLGVVVIDREL